MYLYYGNELYEWSPTNELLSDMKQPGIEIGTDGNIPPNRVGPVMGLVKRQIQWRLLTSCVFKIEAFWST